MSAPAMVEIVISTMPARLDGRLRLVGERVTVPDYTALAFIRAGRAVAAPAVEASRRARVKG